MAGLRYSKQREIIYNTIAECKDHPTADQIYARLKPSCPQLSLGTVYRNLRQMEQTGILLRIGATDGSDHFDARCDHHYHLLCTQCNNVVDLAFPVDSTLLPRVNQTTPHHVSAYSILFYGVCQACQNKKEFEGDQ